MDPSEEYQPLNLEIIKPVMTKSYCEPDFFSDEPRTILNLDPSNSNFATYYMLNNNSVQSVIVRPITPAEIENPGYSDWVKLSYPNCYPPYMSYASPPRVSVSTYHPPSEPRTQMIQHKTAPPTIDLVDGDWRGRAVEMESGEVEDLIAT